MPNHASTISYTDTGTGRVDNRPVFTKRTNPNGWELYKNNQYYKPPKNNQLFNTTTGGNCVWYAYGRFLEVWSKAPESERKAHPWPGSFSNNGVGMVASAAAAGFKTGLTPKPGAIISWGYNGSANGNPGHVAFVEAVNTDAQGKIISIEVSQSGWSSGDLKNWTCYPGPGTKGTKSWVVNNGYCNPYFVGFAYNPIEFAGPDVKSIETSESELDGSTQGIDFQKRASKLISSDSYSFISTEEKTSPEKPPTSVDLFKQSLQNLQIKNRSLGSVIGSAISNIISDTIASVLKQTIKSSPKIIKKQSFLSIADNVVEAPFVEIDIDGVKIGSYNGSLDMYPNYVSDLQVSKQNGVINQYIIRLIHQIRPGDDSNLLDEVLSKVNYGKISIRYGDSNSDTYFQDMNAIITNVRMNRNYNSMNISYTIEATSEGELLKTYTTSFPATTAKPSTVLYDLLYNSGTTSEIILDVFPGMRNKTFVASNNLIPSNDSVVNLDSQTNINIVDYINYLVGCMSNELSGNEVVRNSTYYSSFIDNDSSNPDGAYIQIKEVTANINPYGITDKIYDIDVGYPSNIVYDFSVESTDSWELLYKNNQKAIEYFYTITNNGDIEKYYSPTLTSTLNVMSEINKNWWTQMVKFPVTASLTIKGLLKPVMLMDYININVLFYGQEHITSGVYVITGQTDFLSAAGYRTTLSLIRVGDA